jgi:toxin ParE1/3/4
VRILWTKGAELNLEHIEDYIAQDNPKAALATVHKIIKSIEALAEHPAMGRAGRIFGTRELIVSGTPYIIPYRVKAEHIEVLRVLHSSMRWPEVILTP